MESEISLKEKARNYDVVVEIPVPASQQNSSRKNEDFPENRGSESKDEFSNVELSRVQMNLFPNTSTPAQQVIPTQAPATAPNLTPDPSTKPPIGPAMRRRPQSKSAYSKPKSRIAEPPYPTNSKPAEENAQTSPSKSPYMNSPGVISPSLKVNSSTPKTSAPTTPKTPLLVEEDEDDDDDDEVYKTENLRQDKVKRGKKVKVIVMIEWIEFVSIMAVLITSLTVDKLKDFHIWSLELWKWCVLVLVIFCGRLFTEWLTNVLVFLIEKNFLLKKKVLYFLFGLKKSVRVVVWLSLILLAWELLINRGVRRSEDTSKVLNYITRGIVSTLVGAVMWMVKTLLVKLVASSFHVRTYFDRIQESIFHQYILQALSGPPRVAGDGFKNSGRLSFNKVTKGKQETNGEVINVDKLYKMKREKVSAWTMGGLIKVIRNSELSTISEVLDESVNEEPGGPRVITSEIEAREAANRIFRNVAKRGHKYIDEEDLLQFLPKEEVDNALPLFEGAAESRRIKKSSFRNWVVKAYNERKYLAVSLNDAKTAVEELNKLASGLILVVIVIVWLLLMEITRTRVLVFISSQLLLVVFMFGNTAKMVFEAVIFVFVVHPFDVGDRCVVDGVQMIVDEMNILTTIFLKPDNEKVYYPNSVLATKAISNFNRSPEMMGDAVEFSVDFSTSVESIAALKAKIKAYLESKPQHWSPNHSVQVKEIVDVDKMIMALYVTHTINFQNAAEKGNRRSDLVFELKKIFEEIGIKYHLLPREVHVSYAGAAMPTSAMTAR
ncbi:putative mechanosensitive ion channel [Handroanthus impetiginosus]|uniref:Mechanosensitive ion channel protein n=1 Tax=Handroanthus impetiginosus TaxID=429701 RepID=A0A2G9HLC4_9LAMI|nr:putative mechanosensitive ion channel [Handroanthus impetiginosus]